MHGPEANPAGKLTPDDRHFLRQAKKSDENDWIMVDARVPSELSGHHYAVMKFKSTADRAETFLSPEEKKKFARFRNTKQIHLLDEIPSLQGEPILDELIETTQALDEAFEAKEAKMEALEKESLRQKTQAENAYHRALSAQAFEDVSRGSRKKETSGVYRRPARPSEDTVIMDIPTKKVSWYKRVGNYLGF